MHVTLQTWPIVASGDDWHSDAPPALTLDADAWSDPSMRLLAFDRAVHGAEDAHAPGFALTVRGAGAERVAVQVTLRYQRLFTRRNRASRSARFTALLRAHRGLHACDMPLVRADHDHAIDTWQWVLRLEPRASAAVQAAALLHDVERLDSEAEQRVEQHAPHYLAFKQQHARSGAERARVILREVRADELMRERVAWLIAQHEQPGTDAELRLLNDADALSFFSLNSPGYLAYFGAQQTERKVAYTLARMRSHAARMALRTVRLEPEIAALVARAQPT